MHDILYVTYIASTSKRWKFEKSIYLLQASCLWVIWFESKKLDRLIFRVVKLFNFGLKHFQVIDNGNS